MDYDLELIIPILEIWEIEVSNILYNPGTIGKLTFSFVSYPGNILETDVFYFLISWKSAGPCLTGATRLRSKAFQHSILSSFQYSISRWGICYLMSCRSAIWWLLMVYCTPWMNNLPSTRSIVSTWGGPENQWNFTQSPIHPKIIKMVSQDLQKCPKWAPKRYLKSSK